MDRILFYILDQILGHILGYILGHILGYILDQILGYILDQILGHILDQILDRILHPQLNYQCAASVSSAVIENQTLSFYIFGNSLYKFEIAKHKILFFNFLHIFIREIQWLTKRMV